jgi:hypothetical protein
MKKGRGWRIARRWLQASGAEFWLPLPFVAIAFWFSSNFLMAQELQQPQAAKNTLQADTQLEATVSINILLINAVINQKQGMTQVEVATTEFVVKRLELELAMTDTNQIEAAIAQELGLSRPEIRQLVRYEIVD